MIDYIDLTPPLEVAHFANKNHIKNIKKSIMWLEPYLYKNDNEVYFGRKGLFNDTVIIIVKIQNNNVQNIRFATPDEVEEIINYPLLSPEEINKKLKELYPNE